MSREVERRDKTRPPRRSRKSTLLAQCDALCGKIVRSRGRCEECGRPDQLQWAHGFSRSYRRVRHDLRNGFCLCQGCHLYYTHRPLEWDEWLRERWGTRLYNRMRKLALDGPKVDLRETLATLRADARRLGIPA